LSIPALITLWSSSRSPIHLSGTYARGWIDLGELTSRHEPLAGVFAAGAFALSRVFSRAGSHLLGLWLSVDPGDRPQYRVFAEQARAARRGYSRQRLGSGSERTDGAAARRQDEGGGAPAGGMACPAPPGGDRVVHHSVLQRSDIAR